ncbi:MAG TPA: glycosyltransferase family 39 protein [Candidatus Omnitrophota bacterium]|nr:glycosyltransferase family 39 protein [Candidatus Omnitrophota bacterium]
MSFLFIQFAVSVVFVFGIFLSTLFLSRIFPKPVFSSDEMIVSLMLRSGVGVLVISTLLFIVYSFQGGTVPVIRAMAWGLWCVGAAESFYLLRAQSKEKSGKAIYFVGAGIFFIVASIWCLLPASEKDEMIYHLEIPRQMLSQGGWIYWKDNIYGFFPHLIENFFSLGLAALGETAAKLFHAFFGMLLGATLFAYARKYLSVFWAFAAALILMTVPTVAVMMSWAYVDLAFAWFILLSWICTEECCAGKGAKWIYFSGAFCGAACCIKYTGIQWTLLLAVFILLRGVLRKNAFEAFRLTVILLAAAGVVFSPYLIRNYLMTGWPLYPFPLLGLPLADGFNWDTERTRLFLGWTKTFGAPLGASPWMAYGLAWVRVFTDGEFNNPDRFDGIIGPFFLAIPFLYLSRKMKSFPRAPAAISLLFLYYWLVTTRQARFIVPVLPFLSLMLAYGLSRLPKKAAWLFLAVCVSVNVAGVFQFWNQKQPWNYFLGKETKSSYLARQHRVFPMYEAVNKLLPANTKLYLLHMKNYGYYLTVPWEADFIFERYKVESFLKQNSEPAALQTFFSERQATHLLVDWQALRPDRSGLEEGPFQQLALYLERYAKIIAMKEEMVLYELNILTRSE